MREGWVWFPWLSQLLGNVSEQDNGSNGKKLWESGPRFTESSLWRQEVENPPPQHPPCGGDPPLWAERGRIEVHPPPLADCSVPSSRWRTKDQEARPERSSYCHSRARLTAANQRNLKSSLVHIKEKRLNVCMYFPSFPRFYQMPTTNQPTKQEPEPHPDEAMPTASPGPTQIRANSKEMCLANGCPVLCWPR